MITLRVFGVLHIAMALLGISGDVWKYLEHTPWALAANPRYPYALQFYWIYTSVDLLCLIFLIRAGIALWRLEPRGRWLSNVVLGFEIFWFLADSLSSSLLLMWGGYAERVGTSMMATSAIGAAFQILTGYPLIALIAINVAWRKLNRVSSAPASLHGEAQTGWKPWPRGVLRVLGLLDIIVGLWGLYAAALWFVVVATDKIGVDGAHPYVLSVYRTETAVAVLCFLLLIPTGVALWQLKRRGWWMSCALLILAVAFLLTEQGLRLVLSTRAGEAKAWSNSIENSIGSLLFILPIMLYQLLAVVATTVALRRRGASLRSSAA